ncbi:hypothetical protein C2S52_021198 [Perilla frutescens var. hirtella]|nr:hypothetical protein C2S52_021198 [Perilla frutescens var. hirtella]KAH6808163.1 hypothetical protein C2S51_029271 [Perilla frutescens var. frutescens]
MMEQLYTSLCAEVTHLGLARRRPTYRAWVPGCVLGLARQGACELNEDCRQIGNLLQSSPVPTSAPTWNLVNYQLNRAQIEGDSVFTEISMGATTTAEETEGARAAATV